jgi:N-acylneuraminate cytidylyltransferase
MNNQSGFAHKLQPLFIIPARGGSKGIPKKNIVDLGGRPLIAYSIDGAKEALTKLNQLRAQLNDKHKALTADRIIVSTDSEEIAHKARLEGIEVPFLRPDYLSADNSGSREVILHAMDFAESQGMDYDCVVLLQPTSPFRTGRHIIEALDMFNPAEVDMVVSVCQASANPYYNCFETDMQTGYLHISKGDGLLTRRQDAPKAWEYNGAVYVINPASIREMPLGAFPRRLAYEMSTEDSLDIDTPLDLTVARALINELNRSNR